MKTAVEALDSDTVFIQEENKGWLLFAPFTNETKKIIICASLCGAISEKDFNLLSSNIFTKSWQHHCRKQSQSVTKIS